MAKPFSQRYGYVKVVDVIQVESLNGAARTAIWNVIYKKLEIESNSPPDDTHAFLRAIWIDYLNNSADKVPYLWEGMGYSITMEKILRDLIYKDNWYAVFDMVEFLIENVSIMRKQSLSEALNKSFRKFGVAYTIINYLVTPISSEVEVQSIQEAIANSPESSSLHFERALELMADREQPDYRNSIKESISAIESLCKKITEDDKGTLGKCLNQIEKQGYIHPAMKQAFTQLYGYTSDQGGIRHALSDDSHEPSLEDARFMLIACSAFSNYLLSKVAD
ncbi:AbiJ-NTD4 domain-containing protein [Pantoea vagans]|uniref:AbiJ-NTD4 domain-containing protein n=1 Tax=Pantoea vagans TaxID=470934 RepID=UPI0005107120|nr:hypothetical protein [Pantoea vagans]KGD76057.1 hypothetical protein ID11_10290 [Pantoea vagans]